MGPKSSLSRFFDWSQVLPRLGNTAVVAALPTVVGCPLCGRPQLHVYPDHQFASQWLHCRACEASGDIIELAAATWKLGLPATLEKLQGWDLAKPGFAEADLAPYLQLHARRQQVAKLWRQARDYTQWPNAAEIRTTQRKLGIYPEYTADEWPRRGGQFVGVLDREQLGSLWPKESKHARIPPAWKQCFVIPLEALPGQLVGFLVRDAGNSPEPPLYYPCYRRNARQAASVAFLDAVVQNPQFQLAEILVAMPDPWEVLRWQLRWLREHQQPLPLVSVRTAPTPYGGPPALPANCVFWSPTWQPAIVQQAQAVDGRLAIGRPTLYALERNQPLTWLRFCRGQARSWQTRLETQLQQLPDAEAAEHLRQLAFGEEVLQEFIQRCLPRTQKRLYRLLTEQHVQRIITYCRTPILERRSGWYHQKAGARLCNARIRLEEVRNDLHGPQYYGTVLCGSREFSFLEPVAEIKQQGLFQRISQLAADQEIAIRYNPSWNMRSEAIALLFHPPRQIPTRGLGWNSLRTQFHFPQFTLGQQGKVSVHSAATQTQFPGSALQPPSTLPTRYFRPLCQPGHELFWLALAAVSHNLIAPALGAPCQGVVVGTAAAAAGEQLLASLGCLARPLLPLALVSSLKAARQVAQLPWPVVLTSPAHIVPYWFATGGPNAWLTGDWATTQIALLHGWQAYLPPRADLPTREQLQAASTLLPNYLQDLCTRRLVLPRVRENLLLCVLDDLAQWCRRQVGQSFDYLAVVRHLHTAARAAPLTALVNHFRDAGTLPWCTELPPPPTKLFGYETPETVWLPQAGLNTLLRRIAAPTIEPVVISNYLNQAGALVAETPQLGIPGWLIHRDWWQTQQYRCRAAAVS